MSDDSPQAVAGTEMLPHRPRLFISMEAHFEARTALTSYIQLSLSQLKHVWSATSIPPPRQARCICVYLSSRLFSPRSASQLHAHSPERRRRFPVLAGPGEATEPLEPPEPQEDPRPALPILGCWCLAPGAGSRPWLGRSRAGTPGGFLAGSGAVPSLPGRTGTCQSVSNFFPSGMESFPVLSLSMR